MIAGTITGRPLVDLLLTAIVAMLACWGVGYLIGNIAQRSVDNHIKRYKAAHPLPENPFAPDSAGKGADADEPSRQENDSAADATAANI